MRLPPPPDRTSSIAAQRGPVRHVPPFLLGRILPPLPTIVYPPPLPEPKVEYSAETIALIEMQLTALAVAQAVLIGE